MPRESAKPERLPMISLQSWRSTFPPQPPGFVSLMLGRVVWGRTSPRGVTQSHPQEMVSAQEEEKERQCIRPQNPLRQTGVSLRTRTSFVIFNNNSQVVFLRRWGSQRHRWAGEKRCTPSFSHTLGELTDGDSQKEERTIPN